MAASEHFVRILELEQKQGFTDRAVTRGLDEYLRNLLQTGEVHSRTPLEAAILALPRRGYRQLSPTERREWVQATLARLRADAVVAGAPSRGPTSPGRRGAARLPRSADGAVDYAARARPPQPAQPRPKPSDVASGLEAPVTILSSVRKPTADKLLKVAGGVRTVGDLLHLYPNRHIDFGKTVPINELRPGEDQTVRGRVFSSTEMRFRGGRGGAELTLTDGTGMVRAVWWNQGYLARLFKTSDTVVLSGKPGLYKGRLSFEAPEYEIEYSGEAETIHTGRLVPVYPLTAGLSGRTVRRAVKEALDRFGRLVPETLPAPVRQRAKLQPVVEALEQVHYPDNLEAYERARRRFAFEELFEIQVGVLLRRRQWRSGDAAPRLTLPDDVRGGWLASLPFRLTGAQQKVIAQVLDDVGRSLPMTRLLQGDVGSGKTVVAATALLAAVASGHQGVLMAPTEILAEQHYRTISRLFGGSEETALGGYYNPPWFGRPLRVGLLVGSLSAREKRRVHDEIAAGEVDIAVGTQALIQEAVAFDRLGLAVVDEQHRFGVTQRAELRRKGRSPHLLVMTATPIPRTLQFTIYGDLDVSVLNEMPPGRQPLKTVYAKPEERGEAYHFLHAEVEKGHQAFIICPLVEESEALQVKSAVQEYERLQRSVYPDLRLDLVHGRMPSKEKDAAMRRFRDGDSQVLVATSVVEVGIDIPNATVIMIEGADRFGLAQLHQLRGRVGRGNAPAFCLLVADDPSPEAEERLRLMEALADGFRLAEADLKLRGPGEYFGTRQSGLPDLHAARVTDTPLLEEARAEAEALLDRDPALTSPELSVLKRKVAELLAQAPMGVH